MLHEPNLHNRQVQRTRKWIFEALMILIAEQPYNKITVSDIIKKAGIARQTFYRNYKSKDEVLLQYLKNCVTPDSFRIVDINLENTIQDIVITTDLKYLLEHRKELIVIMKIPDIESIIFTKFKEWQSLLLDNYKHILSRRNYLLFQYKFNYQLVGYLNVVSNWFTHGMPIKVEKLNSILNKLTVSSRVIGGRIPNMIMNIKT
jgi:AcrR family transcriptional regulator